jgi:hypothetical protein
VWTTLHIFTGTFALVTAMACIGIIIQEEQRKRRALDAEVERIAAQRITAQRALDAEVERITAQRALNAEVERFAGPASRRVPYTEDMGG